MSGTQATMLLPMNHTSTISLREHLDLEQSGKHTAPNTLSARIFSLYVSQPRFELHDLPRLLRLHTRAVLHYYTAKTSRSRQPMAPVSIVTSFIDIGPIEEHIDKKTSYFLASATPYGVKSKLCSLKSRVGRKEASLD